MKKTIFILIFLVVKKAMAIAPSLYFTYSDELCVNKPVVFEVFQNLVPNAQYQWYVNEQPVYLSSLSDDFSYTFSEVGEFEVKVRLVTESVSYAYTWTENITVQYCGDFCLEVFKIDPSTKYLLSAWSYVDGDDSNASYNGHSIHIGATGQLIAEFTPEGDVIDGWQKIEGVFEASSDISSLWVSLINYNIGVDVYFDDVRIQPFDASMKTYVYDPVSQKLTAELDENNYATFYDYDNQGELIRVRKETERGVKTIKETRENLKLN